MKIRINVLAVFVEKYVRYWEILLCPNRKPTQRPNKRTNCEFRDHIQFVVSDGRLEQWFQDKKWRRVQVLAVLRTGSMAKQ